MATANYNYGGYTAPEGVNSKDAVKQKQQEMASAGYSPGKVDGLWGAKTQSAYDAYTQAQQQSQQPQQDPYIPLSMGYGGDYGLGALGSASAQAMEALDAQLKLYREQAQKDAESQGKAAYQDYADYINPYGLQRESRAGIGLGGSGVAETSQTGAYNTYQNRAYGVIRDRDRLLAEYEGQINKLKADQAAEYARAQASAEAARAQQSNWAAEFAYNQQQAEVQNQLARDQLALQQQQAAKKTSSSSSSSSSKKTEPNFYTSYPLRGH